MKIRQDFVTNSSSSSFVIAKKELTKNQLKAIRLHQKLAERLDMNPPYEPWEIDENDAYISGFTWLDNFDFHELLKTIGVPDNHIIWDEFPILLDGFKWPKPKTLKTPDWENALREIEAEMYLEEKTTTFQELLKTALSDTEKSAIKLFVANRFDDEDLTEGEKEYITTDFIRRLCEITPTMSKEYILLAHPIVPLFEDEDVTMDVAMYGVKDILEKAENIHKSASYEPAENLSEEEVKACIDEWHKLPEGESYNTWSYIPSGYGFDFTPWEEILGWRVDRENVEETGADEFISFVLYEMSFNGFLEESQKERREELEESLREFEEIKKMPKEEQEKHLIPADKVFSDLSEEYGFELTVKTKEEKAGEDRKFREMAYTNFRNNAIMLEKLVKRMCG